MLRDRVVNLTTPEAVESFLAHHPTSVVFKAGTCHKTMQGFGNLQEFLEPRDDLMVGVIRVVEWRAASNLVAERTGIVHHSPQVIMFQDGSAVFDLDNWDITPESLEVGFARLPQGESVEAASQAARSDLTPYLQVLDQFLSGVIDEQRFEYVYTTMFRDDATLRSRDEVEVLGSIFGDVDRHMTMHMMMAGRAVDTGLRDKAERAYDALTAMATQQQQQPA
ncbi:MAG: thioredoxin family protein [Trueperaceae bacterium]|jgi:bacillithiol system protein YtxJ|nr:MAG: thioredoxin family protein [Trueperaceae bacterium]